MPWPWEVGEWLLDRVATPLAGRKAWRRPFPKESFKEDKRWNDFIVDAIVIVHAAYDVFSTPPGQWSKQHKDFYRAMLEGLDSGE